MTVPEKGISRRCAEFVTSLDHSDLGRETVSVTKKCIVDWLGCVLGGASTPAAGIIKGVVDEMGGREQATMAGYFSKTSVLQAAWAVRGKRSSRPSWPVTT